MPRVINRIGDGERVKHKKPSSPVCSTVMGTWLPDGCTLYLPSIHATGPAQFVLVPLRDDDDPRLAGDSGYHEHGGLKWVADQPSDSSVSKWENMDRYVIVVEDEPERHSNFKRQDPYFSNEMDHIRSYKKFSRDWQCPPANNGMEAEAIAVGRERKVVDS